MIRILPTGTPDLADLWLAEQDMADHVEGTYDPDISWLDYLP